MSTQQIGLLLLVAGAVFLLGSRWLPWLGNLPGDFVYRGQNVQVIFPLGTCLLLSLVLTVIMKLFGK